MATIRYVIYMAFEVMQMLIIIRVFLSWIPHDPRNGLIRFVYEITEPVLAPFRRLIPPAGGAVSVDFSPIAALFCLYLLQSFLTRIF